MPDNLGLAGHLTNAPMMGSYTYDPENRLTGTSGVTYTYDGDGRRVKKSNGKLYWHGVEGQVLQETTLTGTLANEYVFFAGRRTARRNGSGTVFYYFEDHLGSSRVTVQAGQTTKCGVYPERSRRDADYYPYGKERVCTNTCAQNYKFTGQERDAESGLDYFGARYYASGLGRFLQTDPAPPKGRHLINPQKWNKYTYALSNPLILIDIGGHEESGPRTIDVFLAFSADQRSFVTVGGRKLVAPGPDWSSLSRQASKRGYQLNVHGPDPGGTSATRFRESLTTSEIAVYVGHGVGQRAESGKWVSHGIQFGDKSVISTPTGGETTPSVSSTALCLFACNTKDTMPSAFSLTGTAQSVIVVDGGLDGQTNVGTLEVAAYAFLETYINTNGDITAAVKAAQEVIDSSTLLGDTDGDKVTFIPEEEKKE